MTKDNSTPERKGDIKIKVPEIEFNADDPLHEAAITLHVKRQDHLNAAMLLLSESKHLLTAMVDMDEDGAVCATMAKDVRRRVHKALKRLDKQERADFDVYLALAETQRK